ncbi:3-isopropylmalate dehydratase small subunit [Anaerolineae bacterium CFX9]|jgi:3-isopropylmalate/(R)-2-methylmalate dehydratase small subunit|nr:3-isopropylmalate dehydratase small subunit [Geitlerinema splendidum]MDK3160611.1 3-isopropylmalate dehydratase small subunit [Kamptonema cortianum]MDL1900419.1 3-isopropylmalate dehydratase small subunit [Anaerolineae bacterium CFX9]
MEKVTTFTGKVVALAINDIDTDQIIPARYLKVTDKNGLGEACFADWRYEGDGTPKPDFPLNKPEHKGASVLIGGHNFGCGSSREHAPWALMGAGFKAVVSTYFADIFRNNALKNGLLPVIVDEETHRQLISLAEEDAETRVTVDLASQTLTLPDGRSVTFPIDGFSKHCLLNGVDQLGYLLSLDESIAGYEAENPARVNTLAFSQN